MKIAIVTDTHFGARNDSPLFAEYFKKFYDEQFFPYLDQNDIDTVFHLGDIVDRRKYINFSTARVLEDAFIKPLHDRGIDTHMIIGNHDTYYKNTNEINSMRELYENSKYDNLTFYHDLPEVVNIDGCEILMTPWICSGNYEQSMQIIENTTAKILFGHLELKGFQMYKGSVSTHGFDRTNFSKFDIVLSGHFHHKSSDGNVSYLGAPYEITWSDFGDPRGFHIFDTDTCTLTYIQNPLKMFHHIVYDDENTTLEELIDHDFSQYHSRFVKVMVKNKTNAYWFDAFLDTLEKAGPASVQTIEEEQLMMLEEDEDLASEAEDTLTIVNKYINSLDISTDKQKVEDTIKDLYREALTLI